MKRVTLLLLMLAAVSVYAQKTVKPNLNKALSAWKEGKLDEAMTIIDLATTYEKTMNDVKTWYYRGLIYASIDTTSNETFKALSPDAFAIAIESFNKADEMNGAGKELFIQDDLGLPILKSQQMAYWGINYLNQGASYYQEDELEKAVQSFEKAQAVQPTDTLAYFYAGFAANSLEDYDKAIAAFQKYIELGGESLDAYLSIINTYSGPKEDKEEALKWVRLAKPKFPDNADLPKVEIGLLIDLKRIDEAKTGLVSAIKSEPDNKILHFYLGYTNSSLELFEEAKKNYEAALKIDPQYFEAQLYLAKLMYKDALEIKVAMSNLGISAEDKKKRFELDGKLVEKLELALPYWERAEKINPDDQEVLDTLYSIYTDLDLQPQLKRVREREKELGME